MASGDTLLIIGPFAGSPPATLAASFAVMTGGSTPAEYWPCVDFDDASSEYMDFHNLFMPRNYAGTTGVTVTIVWAAPGETVVTAECRWEVAFRRIEDDTDDLDTSHAYAFNGVSADPPSAANEVAYDTITFTDGADMDSVAAGDFFTLRIYRDHDHADDDCTGDARLLGIEIKET
jgi:hypothetical protein